jgi:lactoylglutathione lyase
MALQITGLQHVALPVSNVERSIDFYHRRLGLPLLPRPDFDFPGAWLALGPGRELHLIAGREHPVYSGSRSNHFALEVPDIRAAAAFLEQQGVSHRGPKLRPDGAWQIFLEDPDGHFMELCQIRSLK